MVTYPSFEDCLTEGITYKAYQTRVKVDRLLVEAGEGNGLSTRNIRVSRNDPIGN